MRVARLCRTLAPSPAHSSTTWTRDLRPQAASMTTQKSITTEAASQQASLPSGYRAYQLQSVIHVSSDTKVLRFGFPDGVQHLGPLPSCVKARLELSAEVKMEKSYSPISVPDTQGNFEILVKAYPPRSADHPAVHGPPGGVGAFLCDLKPGDSAMFEIKAPRKMHGQLYYPNRWKHLGLVAAGTGIAPLHQMIRTILSDPNDSTEVSLLFSNRTVDDILLREELDTLLSIYAPRFSVRYAVDTGTLGFIGGEGRLNVNEIRGHLPPPSPSTQVLVCGPDQFVEAICGMTIRGEPPPGKKKGPKLQGPLKGLLAECGYDASMVYNF